MCIYLCRDGGGCLHTVIQWKTAARVLQSGNWANRAVEVKAGTIQKTMIPVLSCENAPACRNLSMTFSAFRLFLLLILLILLLTLERTNAEEYENDLITELRSVRLTVFLCTVEVSTMQSVYDDFSASSYTAYRWDAICNDVFLQMATYLNNGSARIVAHPGSAAGLWGAMLCGTIWNR